MKSCRHPFKVKNFSAILMTSSVHSKELFLRLSIKTLTPDALKNLKSLYVLSERLLMTLTCLSLQLTVRKIRLMILFLFVNNIIQNMMKELFLYFRQ